jgi:hypothetical protein
VETTSGMPGALEDAQERARSVAPACSSGVAVWINWGCVVNVVVLVLAGRIVCMKGSGCEG